MPAYETYSAARKLRSLWKPWKAYIKWSDHKYEEKRFFTLNSAKEWRARRVLERKNL